MNEVDFSVETFDLEGLRVPVLRATMVETQAFVPDLKAALKRVLQAVCLRLHLKQTPTRPSVGPIDGLASLVMMLLAHNTEEEAFWLVVATVEELHARVCLFQGPAEFSLRATLGNQANILRGGEGLRSQAGANSNALFVYELSSQHAVGAHSFG